MLLPCLSVTDRWDPRLVGPTCQWPNGRIAYVRGSSSLLDAHPQWRNYSAKYGRAVHKNPTIFVKLAQSRLMAPTVFSLGCANHCLSSLVIAPPVHTNRHYRKNIAHYLDLSQMLFIRYLIWTSINRVHLKEHSSTFMLLEYNRWHACVVAAYVDHRLYHVVPRQHKILPL